MIECIFILKANNFHKKICCLAIPVLLFFVVYFTSAPAYIEYKKSDNYNYYMLTDSDIKNAPRISDKFYFYYRSPNGSTKEISGIIYQAENSSRLRTYLECLGFYLYQKKGNGLEEIWKSQRNQKIYFVIEQNRQERTIELYKVFL